MTAYPALTDDIRAELLDGVDCDTDVTFGDWQLVVTVEPDYDSSINDYESDGRVEPVRYNRTTGYSIRPNWCDGSAEILTTGRGDSYWWQPFKDGGHTYNTAADRRRVLDLLEGGFVGIVVKLYTECDCCNSQTLVGEESLFGLCGATVYDSEETEQIVTELLDTIIDSVGIPTTAAADLTVEYLIAGIRINVTGDLSTKRLYSGYCYGHAVEQFLNELNGTTVSQIGCTGGECW